MTGQKKSASIYSSKHENINKKLANIKYINQYQYRKFSNKKSSKSWLKKALNLLVVFILSLINVLSFLKDIFWSFFVSFIYKPARALTRVFFYKVVVKLYVFYLRFAKRLGINNRKVSFSSTFNQRFIHVLVVFMTIVLVTINITGKTKASEMNDLTRNTILADLVTSEFGQFAEDEQLVIETFDQEGTISQTQQSYLENLSAFRPQARATMNDDYIEDDQDVAIGDASIIKPNITKTNITKQDRTETVEYTVQPGDTISTIAEKFEISVSTILWENSLSSYSIIRPGDELDILPVTGLTHSVAKNETISSILKKYSSEDKEESFLALNKLSKSDALQVGQKLLVPGGRKIQAPAPKTTSYTGIAAIKNIITTPSTQVASNKMAWPTEGHIITQYYSWNHHGLDIANKVGTPLYAADSGTVEFAGWGTGYGNQIVVNHGGGKKTRYAHMSKFYVSVGDKVTKGQAIGEMGSTGWSTGPHVHFEVIINGTKYNPLNYIK